MSSAADDGCSVRSAADGAGSQLSARPAPRPALPCPAGFAISKQFALASHLLASASELCPLALAPLLAP